MNPPAVAVCADLQSLVEFVDGAEKFTGDVADFSPPIQPTRLLMYMILLVPKMAALTREIVCGGKDDCLPDIFRVASEMPRVQHNLGVAVKIQKSTCSSTTECNSPI